ncbi:16S rRNA (cytidine(1402)-2'-O)-methyltransferase [Actinomycetospora callitridis]|uniref:16S rRNA (cytidine(1402)-2'-O)-methyltransferase n=1 Tax=Actinomycetospora callitridis TaxID=913944 RepID=UPI00236567DE|nr:16S rRNA (cytidine(1402)-2'-O)-methyltransferase [Actinomycetospora callitridis]MDD7916488.1 16S rRNA (cytidine(1402)-2'-O)-methyltransferase [Actinomycetospora callitridis]
MSEGGADGVLLLAGVPLGDPADASARLRAALATADVVAAEDTRRLARLASDLGVGVGGRVVTFREDNEVARTPGLVEEVRGGATVLLVTDGGMPSVSDPGYRVVTACLDAGLAVRCLPGPSAVLMALAVSGLPTDRFCFEGFAPRTDGKRRSWFRELAGERRTVVFFESPRRLASLLAVAVEVLGGDRAGAVCRELTKTHEEVVRGPLADLAAWAGARDVLGEVTVVLGPAVVVTPEPEDLAEEVLGLVADGRRLKDAARDVATVHGVSTKALYDATVQLRK